jgi:hypothetical protein
MPSGSHSGSRGGGGGSHFGGGSSSGSSGGGRWHGRPHGRHVSIVFFGRRVSSAFVALAVFALFLAIVCTLGVSGDKSYLQQIESDYMYYQDMIDDAYDKQILGDSSYLVDGVIISKFQSDTCDKWYVTYYFLDKDGEKVDGYTYSIYTWNQVKDMDPGDIIKLAVDSNPITQDTDSINVDYKYTTLEDDGEYAQLLKKRKIMKTAAISLYIVAGALFISSIIKGSKKEDSDN